MSLNNTPNFQLLFESAPGLFLVLKPNPSTFTILAVSNNYLTATMTKREAILGKGLFEVFPDNPDDPHATGTKNLLASLLRVIMYKQPDTMAVQKYDILRPQNKGGGFEERYWSPHNVPVLDKKNEVIAIIHRVEDVTTIVRLQRKGLAQKRMTTSLLAKTTRIEQDLFLLKKAEEKLQEAIAIRDSFIADASHELKTPVTSIKLFLRILHRQLSTTNNQSTGIMLLKMEKQIDKLNFLISNLLDVIKIEKDTMEFHNTFFDFNTLLDETIISIQHTTKRHTILVNLGGNRTIYGDRKRIGQAIINILTNAIKYSAKKITSTGKSNIIVTTTSTNGMLTLSIEDFGIGIMKKNQKKIFERFYRQRDDGRYTFPGLGLGLYIAAKIIEKHEGKIGIKTDKKQGSTIYFTIPIAKDIGEHPASMVGYANGIKQTASSFS